MALENEEVGFNLNDLDESNYSLEDMNEGGFTPVKVDSPASNTNLAAQATLLSGGPNGVEDTFRSTMVELDDEDTRQGAIDRLNSFVKEKTFNKAIGELTNILADPSFTQEQKEMAANAVVDDKGDMYTPQVAIATESLIQEESNSTTAEQDEVRSSLADVIFEVQKVKRAKQDLLSQAVAGSTADGVTATADFLVAIAPFAEGVMINNMVNDLEEGNTGKAFWALGEQKQAIKDMISKAPADKQLEITEAVINLVNANSSIVLKDSNDFARVNFLRSFIEDGYYEDFDRWVDNVVGVLDLTVLGGSIIKSVKRLRSASTAPSNAARDSVRSSVAPASVSQTVRETNVDQARSMHEAVAMSEGDEVAQALYGTTKEEAIVSDIMPEIAKADGSVSNRVGNPDLNIIETETKNGAIYFTEAEKKQLRADVENKMVQVKGFTPRTEMFHVEAKPNGVKVGAVYGPLQRGISDPDQALSMAEFALRDFGATRDKLTLLRREGDEYVPTTLSEVEAIRTVDELSGTVTSEPDFLVKFDYDYDFNPMDVTKWSELDVKYNIFDRLGASVNSSMAANFSTRIQRYALDPQSMLDEHLTLAANVAVDKAAATEEQLLNLGKNFADGYMGVGKDRQAVLEDIIKEQNHKGRVLNEQELLAQGINTAERQVLRDWKTYWDNVYDLENRDFARSLSNKGYKEYVNTAADTQLFVKPLRKQDLERSNVYDEVTGTLKPLDFTQVDELYDSGATYARMKDPVFIDGKQADLVLIKNTQEGGYARAIDPKRPVLNYREGYYTVNYTDPYFIDMKVVTKDGEYTKAVATSGNIADAKLMIDRLKAQDPEAEFSFRRDEKGVERSFDDRWDVAMNSGRSVQRARGQRLGDNLESGGLDPSQSPILNPVDSMILSARSTANRVNMRQPIETMKQRFMNQYGDFLPTNEFNSRLFPSDISDVQYRKVGDMDSKRLADARTTWEYINYLEAGYINGIDDFTKVVLKGLAEVAGSKGAKKVEDVFNWMSETRGVSAAGKNLAFNMYLATNPLRQLVVQSHQAVQLAANHGKWVGSGRVGGEIYTLTAFQLGKNPPRAVLDSLGMTLEEARDMYDQFKNSGLVASIDKQNLVRGALADMADQVAKKDIKPLTLLRKYGFDAGENFNMMTAWLAHRYKALDEGLDMKDAAVADRVSGLARNYTYNMNAAGDMRYNQDSLALFFQFMQVPHKAITQFTTNRILTRSEKARLALFNGVMYTLPPTAIYTLFTNMGVDLPEDEFSRNLVVQGLEGAVLNKLLNLSVGEGNTDFSGLAPTDMFGLYEVVYALATEGPVAALANTPGGQLVAGNNPRITNLIKTTGRFFGLGDYEETPTTAMMVAKDFLNLSSGMSNTFKAGYMYKYGKTMNGKDLTVTEREAVMQVLGFGTMQDVESRWVDDKSYKLSSELKKDVSEWYAGYKKQLLRDGIEPNEAAHVVRTYGEAWRMWDGELAVAARKELKKLVDRDIKSKDIRMFNNVMRAADFSSAAEFKSMMDKLPESPNWSKEQLETVVDNINSYKE